MTTLKIEQVSKCFGDEKQTVLDDISVYLSGEDSYAIMGPSGCGKSTLLRIVAGYIKPTGGRVLLDGFTSTAPTKQRLMIFQEDSLFPWLNVRENVEFGLRNLKLEKNMVQSMADSMIEKVGLSAHVEKYPKELSGGMRKRAEFARALVLNPKVLLMDEPFSSLDYSTKIEIYKVFLENTKEKDVAVLLVTHDSIEAAKLCNKAYVMNRSGSGKLVELNENRRTVADLPKGYNYHNELRTLEEELVK